MDLFAAYGYRGTSLARIARAAGVTKGALYWHFAGKEEFFLAVTDKVLREWRTAFEKYSPASNREEYRDQFVNVSGVCAQAFNFVLREFGGHGIFLIGSGLSHFE